MESLNNCNEAMIARGDIDVPSFSGTAIQIACALSVRSHTGEGKRMPQIVLWVRSLAHPEEKTHSYPLSRKSWEERLLNKAEVGLLR